MSLELAGRETPPYYLQSLWVILRGSWFSATSPSCAWPVLIPPQLPTEVTVARLMMEDVRWLDLHPGSALHAWVTSASCWPSEPHSSVGRHFLSVFLHQALCWAPVTPRSRRDKAPAFVNSAALTEVRKWNKGKLSQVLGRKPADLRDTSPRGWQILDRAAGKGENLSRELRNEKGQSCENQRKQTCIGPPIPHHGRRLKHCTSQSWVPRRCPVDHVQEKSEDLSFASQLHLLQNNSASVLKIGFGASLMVQRWKVCLAMEGPQVLSLVPKDPTCCTATEPMCRYYWVSAQEPVLHKRTTTVRSQRTTKSSTCLLQLERACMQQPRPITANQ